MTTQAQINDFLGVEEEKKQRSLQTDTNNNDQLSSIKILIIDKGFGNSLQRMKQLKSKFIDKNIEKIILTEPSDKDNYDESVQKLIIKILEYKPSIIIHYG